MTSGVHALVVAGAGSQGVVCSSWPSHSQQKLRGLLVHIATSTLACQCQAVQAAGEG